MTREENRERFRTGHNALMWANENFPCRPDTRGHAVFRAENTKGETIGTPVDEYVRRFGGVPCRYWPNGVSSNQRFSTTRNSAKEAV